jgi:cyclic pyranopterin phosphate synthase
MGPALDRKKKGSRLAHISPRGQARMVDVADKAVTKRAARAEAWVSVGPKIARMLRQSGGVAKGNVIETARIAGVLAAKRTAELIPMCHPLAIDSIELDATLAGDRIRIQAKVNSEGKTGVEMEAMTAAAVAALAVYDMVKSAGKGVEIGPIRLLEKSGGKSGHWMRECAADGQD